MRRCAWLAGFVIACGGATPPEAPRRDDDDGALEPGREGDDDQEVDPAATDRALLDEALRMVGAMRTTLYSHRTTVDEPAGRFDFDCSGFIDYALARSQPGALAELRESTTRRPLAKHFVTFLRSLPEGGAGKWRPLASALDLAPGDIVAWLKPADVVSKNTGHVMIVREPPHRDPDHDDVVVVPIIDSAGVPHGKGDSRKASRVTGLGTGEVLLTVDAANTPIGYRWSRGTKARLHRTTIALGSLR